MNRISDIERCSTKLRSSHCFARHHYTGQCREPEVRTRRAASAFRIELAGRRPGDLARIVAAGDRIRATLKWQPRFDDLPTIVAHALAWERARLCRRPAPAAGTVISA